MIYPTIKKKTSLIAGLRASLCSPLYRNAYALMINTVGTGGLGLVYWVIAARYYSPEIVGQNAALISAMLFLSGVSNLNLMSVMIRFLPIAGRKTRSLVRKGYLANLVVSAVLSSLIILLGLRYIALGFTETGWAVNLVFVLATMATGIFEIQDSVLNGLSQSVWVPVENISYGIAKLVLLIIFSTIFPLYGIYASWTIPMVILILGINLLLFIRLIPRHARATQDKSEAIIPSQIIKYMGGNYLVQLLNVATIRLLPLIVLYQLGPSSNAFFYLPWNIVSSLKLISTTMAVSMTVEGAKDQSKLTSNGYNFMIRMTQMYIPVVVILVFGAPYLLKVSGDQYAAEGTMLLRLLALSSLPDIVTTFYAAIARIHKKISGIIVLKAAYTLIALVLSYLLLPKYDITGVGIAVLVTDILTALAVLPTMLKLRRTKKSVLALVEPIIPEKS